MVFIHPPGLLFDVQPAGITPPAGFLILVKQVEKGLQSHFIGHQHQTFL
jgi:hypothetical protein